MPHIKENYLTSSFIFVSLIKYEGKISQKIFQFNFFIKINVQFIFLQLALTADSCSEYASGSRFRKSIRIQVPNMHPGSNKPDNNLTEKPPLPQASVPPPSSPEPKKRGYATHSTACEGVGKSHLGRLEKKPSTLSTVCKRLSNIVLVNSRGGRSAYEFRQALFRYVANQGNGKRLLFTGAIRLLANQRQRTENLCSFQRNLLSLGATKLKS